MAAKELTEVQRNQLAMVEHIIATANEQMESGLETITTWERRFADSIEYQVSCGRDLSLKQQACLEKIYKRLPPPADQEEPIL